MYPNIISDKDEAIKNPNAFEKPDEIEKIPVMPLPMKEYTLRPIINDTIKLIRSRREIIKPTEYPSIA